MPITVTFDIDETSMGDPNDRNRISACFSRLFWEPVGGSAWRYPALGYTGSEDWLNHVIPALMYFRSIVCHANLDVYNFTIDAHSETGHRGRIAPPWGTRIEQPANILMNQNSSTVLSETRLRDFILSSVHNL